MGQRKRDKTPERIGRYEIQGTLGAGSMGAVYKGFDPLIKRTLAIKTIRLDIPRDSDDYQAFLERFYQEARISGTLSHPNIVTLYDIGEEDGVPFLAMEFVDGETVESRLDAGGRFAPERAVALVRQLAAALDYAHSRGVVHRDVKPANMLLFEERVKITDFGIAKLADANLTRVGQILGTPSYMSPEQATGQPLDGRTDLFSLGVCAFEMLSGEQPFPGDTVTAIVYKIVNAAPVEPLDLEARGLLTPRWQSVFAKVLAKQREARYQSAAEFAADLESCVDPNSSRAASVLPAPAPPPVRTQVPKVKQGGDRTPTPRASPVPESLSEISRDVPTVLMGAAPSFGDPADAEPDITAEEPIPTAEIERPDDLADDEPATIAMPSAPKRQPAPVSGDVPTVLMSSDELAEHAARVGEEVRGDVPTVLMSPDEAPEEATVMMGPSELGGQKVGELPTAPIRLAARGGAIPAPAPPPMATAPPRARTPPPEAVEAAPPRAPGVGAPAAGLPVVGPPAAPSSVIKPLLIAAALFALFFLGLAGIVAWRYLGPTAAATGSLRVESQPAGAALSIGGELKGFTPVELSGLPTGELELQVSLAGFREVRRTVEVSAGDPQLLTLQLVALEPPAAQQGLVDFRSQPAAASVSLDGGDLGQTPLEGVALAPGEHQVVMKRRGYRDWSGSVNVVAGVTAVVEASLERLPRQSTPTTPEPTPTPTATPTPTPTPAPTPEPTPAGVDTRRVYTQSEVDQPPEKVSEDPLPRDKTPRLDRGQSVSVTVSYIVDQDGNVSTIEVRESGGAPLDAAMVETVKKWKYKPARLQGLPVKFLYIRKFTFRAG